MTARAIEQPLLCVDVAQLGFEVMSEIVVDEEALGLWSQVLSKGHSVPSKGPDKRRIPRGVLPLPVPSQGRKVLDAVRDTPRPLTSSARASLGLRFKPHDVWMALVIISLNCLSLDFWLPQSSLLKHKPSTTSLLASPGLLQLIRFCRPFLGAQTNHLSAA